MLSGSPCICRRVQEYRKFNAVYILYTRWTLVILLFASHDEQKTSFNPVKYRDKNIHFTVYITDYNILIDIN